MMYVVKERLPCGTLKDHQCEDCHEMVKISGTHDWVDEYEAWRCRICGMNGEEVLPGERLPCVGFSCSEWLMRQALD